QHPARVRQGNLDTFAEVAGFRVERVDLGPGRLHPLLRTGKGFLTRRLYFLRCANLRGDGPNGLPGFRSDALGRIDNGLGAERRLRDSSSCPANSGPAYIGRQGNDVRPRARVEIVGGLNHIGARPRRVGTAAPCEELTERSTGNRARRSACHALLATLAIAEARNGTCHGTLPDG